MIDKTVMTGMLETYDSFQVDVAVSVLRNLDESNSKVERKVVDFIKGKMFPVSAERICDYIRKMPPDSIRDQVVENLRTFHNTLMEMISFVGNESTRQTVYLPLLRIMERENHPYRPWRSRPCAVSISRRPLTNWPWVLNTSLLKCAG